MIFIVESDDERMVSIQAMIQCCVQFIIAPRKLDALDYFKCCATYV